MVNTSQGQLLKRRREEEGVTLEEDTSKEDVGDHEDWEDEGAGEDIGDAISGVKTRRGYGQSSARRGDG